MKVQTFNIPDGCKTVTFEQVGNQVITTFEPEMKFKEGDFIYSEWENEHAISVLRGKYYGEDDGIKSYASVYSDSHIMYYLGIGCGCKRTDRLATEAEKQILIDALAKDGKMWDAEKLAIVDLKYIPKVGDYVKIKDNNNIYFGEVSDDNVYGYLVEIFGTFSSNGKLHNSDYSRFNKELYSFTKITREELQAEFNKIGYQYDFETHTASKLKWKPKNAETYYFVDTECEIQINTWVNDNLDKKRFEIGNCYKTCKEAEPRQKHYLSFKD